MDDSPWMPPTPGSPRNPVVLPASPPGPASDSSFAPLPPPAPASPWARQELEPPPGLTPPPPDSPLVEPVATEHQPRRSKAVLVGAVIAVLAVGVAGVFAVSRFTGAAEGGAASPSDLGTALFTAIENEDVLGATDLLLPGERDLLRQPMIDLVTELTRLEVLAREVNLADIEGVDIQLGATSVTARPTNVPDIVNVDLLAEATAIVDGEAFPLGDLVTDHMDPDEVAEIRGTTETSTDSIDATLTAVEHDGRWYFSAFYTAAETARADTDADIPEEGIGAQGGESPEAAFDVLLDDIEALDLAGVIRDLNPGEAAALQRYAPLFLDEAEAAVADVPLQVAITDREVHVEGDGDQRTLIIDGLTVTVSAGDTVSGGDEVNGDSQSIEIRIDGSCTRARIDDETFEVCAGDTSSIPGVDEYLADAPAVKAFIDSLGRALSDMQPIGIEMRQYEGAWFVSPTATQTEAILAVLRALDRQEIDELIELFEPAAEEFFGAIFGGFGEFEEYPTDYSSDYSDDDSMFEDSVEDSMFEEYSSDSFGELSGESAEPAGWESCYNEVEAADAVACYQAYVDSGEIDASFIPVVLRFPECGYADVAWGGDLYSMSDSEFIAAVEAARPCFLALVDAGAIQRYELPPEVAHLECFEGRNWYNTYDDPEYDQRYYDCVAAADTP
jgi:hypothetical protein